MNLRPSFDEALLGSREFAADALDGIDCEYRLRVLEHGVKVRAMMRRADFHEHSDNDSEEARQFGHADTLHRQRFVWSG